MFRLLRGFVQAVDRQRSAAARVVCPNCFSDDVLVVKQRRRRMCTCAKCGEQWRDRNAPWSMLPENWPGW